MEWISVDEKLPEGNGDYDSFLVTVSWYRNEGDVQKYVTAAYFNTWHKIWLYENDNTPLEDQHIRVTHWMPFPECA